MLPVYCNSLNTKNTSQWFEFWHFELDQVPVHGVQIQVHMWDWEIVQNGTVLLVLLELGLV